MQALNHVAFGSLIAVSVQQPALAVPLALASHFALDIIPHYGEDHRTAHGTSGFNIRAWADGIASALFVVWAMYYAGSGHAVMIAVCSFLAILPDLFWPLALGVEHKGPLWAFFRFHKGIQHESVAGILVEIPWFIVITSLFVLSA